jgi:hypothetical protein
MLSDPPMADVTLIDEDDQSHAPAAQPQFSVGVAGGSKGISVNAVYPFAPMDQPPALLKVAIAGDEITFGLTVG